MVFQKGHKLSEDIKRKISEANKGKHPWNKGKKLPRFSGENNGMFGKKHTEEVKIKISLAKLGKHPSEEAKKRMSLANKGRKHTEETKRKIGLSISGNKNSNWKGGKFLQYGYIFVLKPEHPFCDKRGYVREHRLVMEEKLGRYLKPEEEIHHIDFDKTNNNTDNLYLFYGKSEHTIYHHFLKSCIKEELRKKT